MNNRFETKTEKLFMGYMVFDYAVVFVSFYLLGDLFGAWILFGVGLFMGVVRLWHGRRRKRKRKVNRFAEFV